MDFNHFSETSCSTAQAFLENVLFTNISTFYFSYPLFIAKNAMDGQRLDSR